MPWINPDAQDPLICPISVLPCRPIILVQTLISLILPKTEKPPGQPKAPRHLPRWQVVASSVMKTIPFTIRQVHGITVTSITRTMYFAIIT